MPVICTKEFNKSLQNLLYILFTNPLCYKSQQFWNKVAPILKRSQLSHLPKPRWPERSKNTEKLKYFLSEKYI